jgi:hypothetical protein
MPDCHPRQGGWDRHKDRQIPEQEPRKERVEQQAGVRHHRHPAAIEAAHAEVQREPTRPQEQQAQECIAEEPGPQMLKEGVQSHDRKAHSIIGRAIDLPHAREGVTIARIEFRIDIAVLINNTDVK